MASTIWVPLDSLVLDSGKLWHRRTKLKTHLVMIIAVYIPTRVVSKYLTYNIFSLGRCEGSITIDQIENLRFRPTFPSAVRICCISEGIRPFFPHSPLSFSPPFSPPNCPRLLPPTGANIPPAQNTLLSPNVNLATGTRKTTSASPTLPVRSPWVESVRVPQ
jgi:hypothetical protein